MGGDGKQCPDSGDVKIPELSEEQVQWVTFLFLNGGIHTRGGACSYYETLE
jgi:hypothetical protein